MHEMRIIVTDECSICPSVSLSAVVECGEESVYDIRYTGERQGGYKQTHIV